MSIKYDIFITIYNYWSDNSDGYIKQLPLASSPFYLIASLSIIFFAVKSIEFFRRNTNPNDIRPLLIIYDGFLFGVFGTGFIMFFVASNFGSFIFSCSRTGSTFRMELNQELVVKHLVYTYIIMLVVSLANQILITFGRSKTRALRISSSSRGAAHFANYWEANVFGDSFITLIHQSLWTIIVSYYLVTNPVGETLFEPLIDCLNYVFYYGCGILLVTERVPVNISPRSKSSKKRDSSSFNPPISLKVKLREMARFVCFCAISVHTFYILSNQGHCHPPSSRGAVSNYHQIPATVVSIYSAIFAAINLIRIFGYFQDGVVPMNEKKQSNGKVSYPNKYRRVTRFTKIPVAVAQ